MRRSQAHPRSRGENRSAFERYNIVGGSSPLTRGKQCADDVVGSHPGLIPAHAGKTISRVARAICCAAHPRSRGENLLGAAPHVNAEGSSPLTRGKPCNCPRCILSVRLIPAHAGKTCKPLTLRSGPGAHPRSRGENTPCIRVWGCIYGSSPLTRGKHRRRCPHAAARGLIPAHAGKTTLHLGQSIAIWAHPRSRGENASSMPSALEMPGSSPLTRGKR